jgi:hypothetical protein
MNDEKVRENRLRRAAARQGYAIEKSRARDPRTLGFGLWRVIDPTNNSIVAGWIPWDYSMDLDDVEAWVVASDEERASMGDNEEEI